MQTVKRTVYERVQSEHSLLHKLRDDIISKSPKVSFSAFCPVKHCSANLNLILHSPATSLI